MGAKNVYRVITQPTGAVWIRAYPDRGCRDRDATAGMDFESADALEQVLPKTAQGHVDRTHRNKWRWIGGQIRPDLSLPDPPLRHQAVIDEVSAATTMGALRTALVRYLRGGG